MKQKILCWSPRILAILAILFMMMFSADCLEEGNTLSNKLICLFMHNIPAFICIGALIMAWKWPFTGGVFYIFIFIAATIFFESFSGNATSLIVITPFLLTGNLFILDYQLNRKKVAI